MCIIVSMCLSSSAREREPLKKMEREQISETESRMVKHINVFQIIFNELP